MSKESGDGNASKPKRLTIKQGDRNRLFALSMSRCAMPDCNNELVSMDEDGVIGEIAHIQAASAGGPRYNPAMTDDERRNFDNLILLCPTCHTKVDCNEKLYSVELLQEYKKQHEEKTLKQTIDEPSMLVEVIRAIANINFNDNNDLVGHQPLPRQAFKPEDKITYNNVQRYQYIIDEQKLFYGKLNALYQELENNGTFVKEILLNNIHRIYLGVKGKYIKDRKNEMIYIRKYADQIFKDVASQLQGSCKKATLRQESIHLGVSIIMVDAFIRCKILEEPKDESLENDY